MTLNGGCCEDGVFFGPWYLYGVGIVNPESEEAISYAIGYGDGGLLAGSQLYPGLLKLSGDPTTGELGGFEYITSNITYSTSGSDMQATALMDYITNDSQWGLWPNSFNGFIVLGGFSFEDRSRSGIIASLEPVVNELKKQALLGKPILGICNGAQILLSLIHI